jgi:hypothetical protein
MTLRFSYAQEDRGHPLISLGGRSTRPRPIIAVSLIGPKNTWVMDALLDTGSDDTVFPERVATLLGIDLTNAPTNIGAGAGSQNLNLRYAQASLARSRWAERGGACG